MCAAVSPQLVVTRRSPETIAERVPVDGRDDVALSVVTCTGDVQWVADAESVLAPSDLQVVHVEDDGSDGRPETLDTLTQSVEAVPATDLAAVGVAVHEFLADCEGSDAVVLVDSVDDLVQNFGLQRTFRFVHVLRQRTDVSDAMLSFLTDPETDDETMATLDPLFERVESRP